MLQQRERTLRAAPGAAGGASRIRELSAYLWARKWWALIPLVATLLLVAVLFLIGEATGIAPFVYTLF
jgi:uncharacterized protein DUF5989